MYSFVLGNWYRWKYMLLPLSHLSLRGFACSLSIQLSHVATITTFINIFVIHIIFDICTCFSNDLCMKLVYEHQSK
jgi:hypothetical protein